MYKYFCLYTIQKLTDFIVFLVLLRMRILGKSQEKYRKSNYPVKKKTLDILLKMLNKLLLIERGLLPSCLFLQLIMCVLGANAM